MNAHAVLDELEKLGAVSDHAAQRALDRLDALQQNKPSAGQVARYAGLGAVAAPAVDALRNVVRGEHAFSGTGWKGKLRGVAASAIGGAVGMGALPLARQHFDRQAEIGTLKRYLNEHEPPAPTKVAMTAIEMAVPAFGGLLMGYSPGRNVAGETAAAMAPEGRVTRSENIARQAAIAGAPLGGIGAMALAHRYNVAGRLAKGLAKKFPQGLAAHPSIESGALLLGVPLAAGLGGSLLGGLATGAGVGAVQSLRGPLHQKKEYDKEKTSEVGETLLGLMGKLAEEHKLQGHVEHQGLPVAIENRKGSVRKGVDKDGKPWRTVMKHPYGYIEGTKGKDGEEVDAYVGPAKNAPNALVVHQHKEDGTGHDEDKVMLGFSSEEEARKAYLAHYNDPKFLGPISVVPVEKLKKLVEEKKVLRKISSLALR